MNASENTEKSKLERRELALDRWMYVGMAMVLMGVIAEAVPDFLSSNPMFILIVRRIGESLVALGLLGEFNVDIRLRKTRSGLKALADKELEHLRLQTAQAEQAAAEANLARLRLEAKLADRHVSGDQSDVMGDFLHMHGGKVLTIRSIQENEAIRFASELTQAFTRSGIIVFPGQPFEGFGIDSGLALFVGKGADEFADAISSALVEADVVSEPVGRVYLGQERTVMLRVGPK